MIHLSTGLPGAGKTLYTIAYVKELAERENRPVFYSGIKDLALPWTEIEADKWMDCPPGSIIVIDECQRVFRPRASSAQVPAYVSGLETHRHQGLDLFLVTQHPMLIDSNVRRLTERHFHICRRFGMHRSTILQFESCKDQPLAKTANANRLEWKYPKEVFNYYKSAEVHTVKRRIPTVVWVFLAAPLVVGSLIWYFVSSHYQDGHVVLTKPTPAPATTAPPAPQGGASGSGGGGKDRPRTVAEYIHDQTPRIDGLAYTAPIYDEITKPVEAPVPAMCIQKPKGCSCYSQQGTRMVVPDYLCHSIVKDGLFIAWQQRNDQNMTREKKEEERQQLASR